MLNLPKDVVASQKTGSGKKERVRTLQDLGFIRKYNPITVKSDWFCTTVVFRTNMKLHSLVIFLLIASLSGKLYAENPWTYSLGISGVDYNWVDEASGNLIQEQMVGLDIRGSSIRNLTGFYYGSYISIARPMVSWNYEEMSDTVTMDYSRYDMYLSFGIPFGYRWQMPGISSAFYLGIGPSFQGLFDFDSHLWGSGGLFWEFGFETLKIKGVSFSVGGRVIMSLGSFVTDGSSIAEAVDATGSAFFIGMSWTGNRGY